MATHKRVWEFGPTQAKADRMYMAFKACIDAGYPQEAAVYSVHFLDLLSRTTIAYFIRDPSFVVVTGDKAIPYILKDNLDCLVRREFNWCKRKSSVAKRARLLTMFPRHLHLILPLMSLHQFVEGMWVTGGEEVSDTPGGPSRYEPIEPYFHARGEGKHAPVGIICDWLEDNGREQEGIALRVLDQPPPP